MSSNVACLDGVTRPWDTCCDDDDGGNDVVRVCAVGGADFVTIQEGIDAAPVPGVVEVCPGTYVEDPKMRAGVDVRAIANMYSTGQTPATGLVRTTVVEGTVTWAQTGTPGLETNASSWLGIDIRPAVGSPGAVISGSTLQRAHIGDVNIFTQGAAAVSVSDSTVPAGAIVSELELDSVSLKCDDAAPLQILTGATARVTYKLGRIETDPGAVAMDVDGGVLLLGAKTFVIGRAVFSGIAPLADENHVLHECVLMCETESPPAAMGVDISAGVDVVVLDCALGVTPVEAPGTAFSGAGGLIFGQVEWVGAPVNEGFARTLTVLPIGTGGPNRHTLGGSRQYRVALAEGVPVLPASLLPTDPEQWPLAPCDGFSGVPPLGPFVRVPGVGGIWYPVASHCVVKRVAAYALGANGTTSPAYPATGVEIVRLNKATGATDVVAASPPTQALTINAPGALPLSATPVWEYFTGIATGGILVPGDLLGVRLTGRSGLPVPSQPATDPDEWTTHITVEMETFD